MTHIIPDGSHRGICGGKGRDAGRGKVTCTRCRALLRLAFMVAREGA